MGAVYKKELKSFFTTMTGYVFIAVILVAVGVPMALNNFLSLSNDFESNFSSILFIILFLFSIPLITVRSFAEERRSRTDQLLYSLPLSVSDVVLGKYLAMLTLFVLPCVLMLVFPIIFSMYGTVLFIKTYSSIFALFLFGSALIAICMFISSLTESQVISAVVSLLVVFLSFIVDVLIVYIIPVDAGTSLISLSVINLLLCLLIWYMTKNTVVSCAVALVIEIALIVFYLNNQVLFEGLISKVLSSVSLFDRLGSFVNGMFDLTSVVYYLSVMIIFVFFTCQAVEKRRWS